MRSAQKPHRQVASFSAHQWLLWVVAVAGLFAMHVLTVSVADGHAVAGTSVAAGQHHHGTGHGDEFIASLAVSNELPAITAPDDGHGSHETLCVAVLISVVLFLGIRRRLRHVRQRFAVHRFILPNVARPQEDLFSVLSVMRL